MAETEQKQVFIEVNEELPNELKKLEAEGWKVIPGIAPVAIYSVFREKPPTNHVEFEANMVIDDSKVHIIRDGKIVG